MDIGVLHGHIATGTSGESNMGVIGGTLGPLSIPISQKRKLSTKRARQSCNYGIG